ncbi:MAG: hypothetical protein K2P81_04610 [Bacteriovoracaceae bacterium]|nr:hypothetical protein [Bacteriovoracaceae bacterium]
MKTAFTILTILFALHAQSVSARTYMIFSVAMDLPMGEENEVLKKNFYVNIGTNQGVKKGTLLDVFRVISVLDPYDNRKRVNYRVKIGELKVLEANEDAAISVFHKNKADVPVLDLDKFIVGDHVAVNVD